MSSVSDRIYTMLASNSDGLPVVNVESFKQIDNKNFAVMLSSIETNKRYYQQDYSDALGSITKDKLSIVTDSLFKVQSTGSTPLMRCIASVNSESKPVNDKAISSMKKISSNVLEDDDGVMWKMVGDGENRRIVSVSSENFGELLAKRRRINQMTASIEDNMEIDYQDTDFVYFVNPELEAMDFGFAIRDKDRNYVVSKALKSAVKIDPHQVMEAASTAGVGLNLTQRRREIQASSGSSLKDWIAYLTQLYGRNSEYVKEWSRAISQSANRVA